MAWAPGAYFTNHQRKQVSCNKIRRGFQNPSIFCRHLSGDKGVLFYQLCEPFLPVSSRSISSNKMWLGQTRLHPYEPISAPLISPPRGKTKACTDEGFSLTTVFNALHTAAVFLVVSEILLVFYSVILL